MSVIKTFMKINNLQSQPWHSLADILAMPGPRILTRAFQLLFLDALLRLGAHVGMNTQMFALLGWRLSLLSGQVRNMKNNTGDPTKIIWLKHIVQETLPNIEPTFPHQKVGRMNDGAWDVQEADQIGTHQRSVVPVWSAPLAATSSLFASGWSCNCDSSFISCWVSSSKGSLHFTPTIRSSAMLFPRWNLPWWLKLETLKIAIAPSRVSPSKLLVDFNRCSAGFPLSFDSQEIGSKHTHTETHREKVSEPSAYMTTCFFKHKSI